MSLQPLALQAPSLGGAHRASVGLLLARRVNAWCLRWSILVGSDLLCSATLSLAFEFHVLPARHIKNLPGLPLLFALTAALTLVASAAAFFVSRQIASKWRRYGGGLDAVLSNFSLSKAFVARCLPGVYATVRVFQD